MKKVFHLFPILLIIAGNAVAREPVQPVVSGVDITVSDTVIGLSFEIELARTSRGSRTIVFMPQITDGANTVCFPPVVVQSKRGEISWVRHRWSAGSNEAYPDAIYLKYGTRHTYHAVVPLQQWMYGADLFAEVLTAGCCSVSHDRILLSPDVPVPDAEPEEQLPDPVTEIPEAPHLTTAEEMAEIFSFVLPADEYDPGDPLKLYDDERDGGIIIYYHINRYDIDEDYADNRQTLTNLLAAIDIIRVSQQSDISRVFVAGFASPDGPFEFNDRLAWERAVSVKEYILRNSSLPDELITLYNGSADWQGLRLLVTSDRTMPGRAEVLDIIDNRPMWDSVTNTGRLSLLQQLNGGNTWKYMAEHIFPKLRNGAFIRVYYSDN